MIFRYRIEKTDESDLPFSIDEESGRIRVNAWLDYEMKTEYSFNVMVKVINIDQLTDGSITDFILLS